MSAWYRLQISCENWDENDRIIREVILPLVEDLEASGDIINFFFLNEPEDDDVPQRVMFCFYGERDIVESQLESNFDIDSDRYWFEDYDPSSESDRFGDYYMLGIRMFEVGSRFALANIKGDRPVDMSGNETNPIVLTLRHAYCQNLLIDDSQGVPEMDIPLIRFYERCFSN